MPKKGMSKKGIVNHDSPSDDDGIEPNPNPESSEPPESPKSSDEQQSSDDTQGSSKTDTSDTSKESDDELNKQSKGTPIAKSISESWCVCAKLRASCIFESCLF